MKIRREDELADTGDSTFDQEKKRLVMDNFWSKEKDTLLLKEIAKARSRIGTYGDTMKWDAECWNKLLCCLRRKDPDFNSQNVKDLQSRQYWLKTNSQVHYGSPPKSEEELLYYNAFNVGMLPPPPDPRVCRRQSQLPGMNVNSNIRKTIRKTITRTTNTSASGSCSADQRERRGKLLGELLLDFKDDLNDIGLLASLGVKGEYETFNRMRENLSREAFVDYLRKFGSNNNQNKKSSEAPHE